MGGQDMAGKPVSINWYCALITGYRVPGCGEIRCFGGRDVYGERDGGSIGGGDVVVLRMTKYARLHDSKGDFDLAKWHLSGRCAAMYNFHLQRFMTVDGFANELKIYGLFFLFFCADGVSRLQLLERQR